jgi:membrane-associated phospholipid phosphatase
MIFSQKLSPGRHREVDREPLESSLHWFGIWPATWIACLVSAAATAALLRLTHTSVVTEPFLAFAGVTSVTLSIHLIYTSLRPEPRLAAIAGGLTAVLWGGIAAGVGALAALRTNAPLIDDQLAHADLAPGLNTEALVAWVAGHQWLGSMLDVAYLSAVPLVVVLICLLPWLHREARMWQICFVFVGAAEFCALFTAGTPAVGAIVHYDVSSNILTALPEGAGRFYLHTFEAYRSGYLDRIDIRHMEGVVTFPSFHAVMALMIGYALNDVRRLSIVAWVWSGLIMISTIPIGGHYAVDLVAGAAVWAAFTKLARKSGNLA